MLDVFPTLYTSYNTTLTLRSFPLYHDIILSVSCPLSMFSSILGLVLPINQLLSAPGGKCNDNMAKEQTNEQPVSQPIGIQPRARPSYSGLTNNIPDPSISDRLLELTKSLICG